MIPDKQVMKKLTGILSLLLLSFSLYSQDVDKPIEDNGESPVIPGVGLSENSGFGQAFGGIGGWGGEVPTLDCPTTVEEWNTFKDKMASNQGSLQFSQVKSADGEVFNPMQDPRFMIGGFMGDGFGGQMSFDPKNFPEGTVFSKNPTKDKLQYCIDKGKFDEDQRLQISKCMSRVPEVEPLIDPQDSRAYYEQNKPIFEQSSTMSKDGKTPKITLRDPIMNDPDMYRKIDHPQTRDQAIKDLRAKVQKLGGEVFYDESAIGGGFGRVEVMIPGKDGCDRHYSIQTAAPNDNSPTPSGIKNLPVATVCMKDPFTGKKLDKPAGFLMFYDRNYPQEGDPKTLGVASEYPEEGIFPSQSFNTMHSGATNCKSCHVTPYLPFVGDSNKLPKEDKVGFDKIKKRSNSLYPTQTWAMVREEDGQKYIAEFFDNTDRGPLYGASESENRDEVLNHCLEGNEKIRSKIKKAMDCQSCHNGVTREFLTGGDGIEGSTFAQYIRGEGMYAKHAMPPENELDESERRILIRCLDSELNGVQNWEESNPDGSSPKIVVEGNVSKWKKAVSCIPTPKSEDSDECEDCPSKMDVHDDLHSNELFNISEISTGEGMVYVLPKDNSGADPEGNFGEMNLSLTELHKEDGSISGYKRPVFSGICVEFCSPSEFDVVTDEKGEFVGVNPTGMSGLQIHDETSNSKHRSLNPDEVKVLNNFIKEKLAQAKEDGGLFIKQLIEEVGAEKLKNKHEVDAVSGATYVKRGDKKMQIPKELKGGFNTVATALLYAYDTQVEVKNLKK